MVNWGCDNITNQVIELNCSQQCQPCDHVTRDPGPVPFPLRESDLDLVRAFGNQTAIPGTLCLAVSLVNNAGLKGPNSPPVIINTQSNTMTTSLHDATSTKIAHTSETQKSSDERQTLSVTTGTSDANSSSEAVHSGVTFSFTTESSASVAMETSSNATGELSSVAMGTSSNATGELSSVVILTASSTTESVVTTETPSSSTSIAMTSTPATETVEPISTDGGRSGNPPMDPAIEPSLDEEEGCLGLVGRSENSIRVRIRLKAPINTDPTYEVIIEDSVICTHTRCRHLLFSSLSILAYVLCAHK